MITVVIGHVCSGKTTYVLANARRGDVIIDMDRMAHAMTTDDTPDHDYPQHVADIAKAALGRDRRGDPSPQGRRLRPVGDPRLPRREGPGDLPSLRGHDPRSGDGCGHAPPAGVSGPPSTRAATAGGAVGNLPRLGRWTQAVDRPPCGNGRHGSHHYETRDVQGLRMQCCGWGSRASAPVVQGMQKEQAEQASQIHQNMC